MKAHAYYVLNIILSVLPSWLLNPHNNLMCVYFNYLYFIHKQIEG